MSEREEKGKSGVKGGGGQPGMVLSFLPVSVPRCCVARRLGAGTTLHAAAPPGKVVFARPHRDSCSWGAALRACSWSAALRPSAADISAHSSSSSLGTRCAQRALEIRLQPLCTCNIEHAPPLAIVSALGHVRGRPRAVEPIPHTMLALSTECLEGEGH